jgi:hypothetical protein
MSRSVQVDAVTFLEVGFRLAGNDRRQMEDNVRPSRDEFCSRVSADEIARRDSHREGRGWGLRRDHVMQRQARDVAPVEAPVPRQAFGQFAADHAGGAENKDMH